MEKMWKVIPGRGNSLCKALGALFHQEYLEQHVVSYEYLDAGVKLQAWSRGRGTLEATVRGAGGGRWKLGHVEEASCKATPLSFGAQPQPGDRGPPGLL